jgi:hypothetical protein
MRAAGLLLAAQVVCMLTHMRDLRVLSLSLPYVITLSRLVALRHLVLNVGKKLAKQTLTDLGYMYATPALETLAISMHREHVGVGYIPAAYYQMGEPESGELDLQRCRSLRAVLLSHLAPAFLKLPPGCHLTLHGPLEMAARVHKNGWGESLGLEKHMRTLSVTTDQPYMQDGGVEDDDFDLDVLVTLEDKLQHLLRPHYSCLVHLRLTSCDGLGTPSEPLVLGPNLATLRSLCLLVVGNGHMFVSIAKAIQPEALSLVIVHGVLRLFIEDVGPLAGGLSQIQAMYGELHGVQGDNSLPALQAKMAELGKPMKLHKMGRPPEPVCHAAEYRAECSLYIDRRLCQAYDWAFPEHQQAPCHCEACEICLQRASLMEAF